MHGSIIRKCLISWVLKFLKTDLHGMNLQRQCKTLMEHKDELGIEYPTIINDMSSAIDTMYPWITEAGGSYLNDDGTCGWNSDEPLRLSNMSRVL